MNFVFTITSALFAYFTFDSSLEIGMNIFFYVCVLVGGGGGEGYISGTPGLSPDFWKGEFGPHVNELPRLVQNFKINEFNMSKSIISSKRGFGPTTPADDEPLHRGLLAVILWVPHVHTAGPGSDTSGQLSVSEIPESCDWKQLLFVCPSLSPLCLCFPPCHLYPAVSVR